LKGLGVPDYQRACPRSHETDLRDKIASKEPVFIMSKLFRFSERNTVGMDYIELSLKKKAKHGVQANIHAMWTKLVHCLRLYV